MFANPFVWPSCHVHAQVFAQRNRCNAWVDWRASVYRISADPIALHCFTLTKWLFLTEHATTLGYVLTALFFPTHFSLVVTVTGSWTFVLKYVPLVLPICFCFFFLATGFYVFFNSHCLLLEGHYGYRSELEQSWHNEVQVCTAQSHQDQSSWSSGSLWHLAASSGSIWHGGHSNPAGRRWNSWIPCPRGPKLKLWANKTCFFSPWNITLCS